MKKTKAAADEDSDEDDVPDDEEKEAAAEVDPDREAHNAQEIEELSEEVERDLEDVDNLDLTEEDVALGRSAVTKVCRLVAPLFLPTNRITHSVVTSSLLMNGSF